MNATVWFEQNGGEYLGYLRVVDVPSIAFDPEREKAIDIGRRGRLELDERITRIDVDGYGEQTTAEAWRLPRRRALGARE